MKTQALRRRFAKCLFEGGKSKFFPGLEALRVELLEMSAAGVTASDLLMVYSVWSGQRHYDHQTPPAVCLPSVLDVLRKRWSDTEIMGRFIAYFGESNALFAFRYQSTYIVQHGAGLTRFCRF